MLFKNAILLLCLILFFSMQSYAQNLFTDSLKLTLGTIGTIASKDYQPLWSVSNRFGVITDQKSDLSTFLSLNNIHVLSDSNREKQLEINYGLDLFNNKGFNHVFLQQAFVRLKYGAWQLRGGRYREIIGEVDPDLSSGSLGVSGNALPITKIGIALTKYIEVPYTHGWLQVKGLISHGWMGKDQYMKDAFLHEKTLYLRLGKNRLKLYGGVQHFAVWGGNRGEGFSLDRSFKGFLNVLLVKEADDGSVGDGLRPNRAGDHRGALEAGLEYDFDKVKLNIYNQTPFDMGQGIDVRNIDRLLGVSMSNKTGSFWKKVLAEFIYTKQMNNFYTMQYRESYYNNGVYKTGWEYEDRIIGTPLFINRHRGSKYFSEIEPYNWEAPDNKIPGLNNIINNRIVGGHLGALYTIRNNLDARTLLTYTRNFGSYSDDVFKPYKNQCYTLQEISYTFEPQNIVLTVGFAYDFGQLSDNTGCMLGIKYNLK